MKKTKDYDSDIGFDNKDLFLYIGILKELDTEIGILEDNTEEIEELKGLEIHTPSILRDKINELVKAVNKLRKEKE